MYGNLDFDSHEQVVFDYDAASDLRLVMAIHSTVRGPALGGCRMREYASTEQAVSDALRLSRAMSYKHALGDRPFGGGKAVIIGNPRKKSDVLLQALAKSVQRLNGRYITAEDAGFGVEDVRRLGDYTDCVRNLGSGLAGPAPFTAHGVFIGIQTAIEFVLGRSLERAVVSVQGLGSVGMLLCGLLHEAGAQLLVSDIDDEKCDLAVSSFGAERVPTTRAHSMAVDVYAPCALGGVLNAATITELAAPIVVGAANNQLATEEDGARLAQRGVVYCPDYVVNAGGIRATALPGESFDHAAAMRRVEGLATVLREILELSRATGAPANVVADRLARERLSRGR